MRVGDDPASVSYVRKKGQTAAEIGIESRVLLPPVTIRQEELEGLVDSLNADPGVDGILVQSPLPAGSTSAPSSAGSPRRRTSTASTPLTWGNSPRRTRRASPPARPAGIMELLAAERVDLEGKHVVVLGRSLIVGKPAALLAAAEEGGRQRDRHHLPLQDHGPSRRSRARPTS